ncbi:hypothetical protein GCM10007939_08430 [Amylibacter marinus]|uniref:Uncharacterized protein n=1 Tax=Amylibacter marinus TaxID=1475483 RepID=A0ABQ5VT96_9RHOB|nr:hypothetical protein [Amylibacter marinus]GLQ34560.1 hypothetical protein GCM10007939_08430 [Amylibacter marinus]
MSKHKWIVSVVQHLSNYAAEEKLENWQEILECAKAELLHISPSATQEPIITTSEGAVDYDELAPLAALDKDSMIH